MWKCVSSCWHGMWVILVLTVQQVRVSVAVRTLSLASGSGQSHEVARLLLGGPAPNTALKGSTVSVSGGGRWSEDGALPVVLVTRLNLRWRTNQTKLMLFCRIFTCAMNVTQVNDLVPFDCTEYVLSNGLHIQNPGCTHLLPYIFRTVHCS